jgi:trans-aconitate methyltransferase
MSTTASNYAATDGAAYEIFLGRWTRALGEAFAGFIEPPADGSLLDVGCGTGSLAGAMAKRWPGRKVSGVDVSPAYVEFARAQTPQGSVDFSVADAADIKLPDRSYAAAAAQLVLNFIPEPKRALAEMMRVIAPGGIVAAAVWDFRGGLTYQRIFRDTAAGIDPKAGAARDKLFSGALALPDGLVELFRRCGVGEVERGSLTIRMDYASFDDYWHPLFGGQGPAGTYAAGLDPATRAKIETAVRAAFLSGAPDGPRSLTATAWAVRGRVRS